MRRSGFEVVLGTLVLAILLLQGCFCAPTHYDENKMGSLATLSRVTMDVVWGMTIGEMLPDEMDEGRIKAVVAERGTPVEGLDEALDTYDMKIVFHDLQMEAIFWDPQTNRKLIEDLRCTQFVDFKAWEVQAIGSQPTLNGGICGP